MGMFRKRGGGGFLNNTDGVIESYALETKVWNEGTKSEYSTLTLKIMVKPDGAEEAVEQFLRGGFFSPASAVISEDEQSAMGLDKDGEEVELQTGVIEEGSEAHRFLASVIDAAEASGADVQFPENGESFSALNNLRVTFLKVTDRDEQVKLGRARIIKKKGKAVGGAATEEQCFEAGKTPDKKDATKSYNLDFLTVSAVHGYEEVAAKKGARKPVAAAKAAPKAKAAARVEESDDITTQAKEVLTAILENAKDNTILRSQVSGKVVAYCNDNGIENEVREQLREVMFGEAFLKSEDGWSYNGKDRKQPISLAS